MNFEGIKAIAFDFGGTLDIPGVHWFDFLWSLIQEGHFSELEITEVQYYDAYVFAERRLEILTIPEDTNMMDLLKMKFTYQLEYLNENKIISINEAQISALSLTYAFKAFTIVDENLDKAREILERLSCFHKIYIVSNYYGNLKTILEKAQILPHITKIFDSTVVGIRKPDPEIWRKALEHSGCKPKEFLVVGDSMKNDILPAISLGCPAILINKEQQEEEYMGVQLHDLEMIPQLV